jgi:hypothetical protein
MRATVCVHESLNIIIEYLHYLLHYLLQDFPPKLVLLPLNALMVRFNFADGLNASAVVASGAGGSIGSRGGIMSKYILFLQIYAYMNCI